MILSWQEMNAATPWGAETFAGRALDSPATTWQSVVPFDDLPSFAESVLANPAIAFQGHEGVLQRIDEKTATALRAAQQMLGNMNLVNFVRTTRGLFAQQVQTVGVLSDFFSSLHQVYLDPEDVALQVINVVKGVWESEAFQMGLDAIGAIPVVGWIVKVAIDIAEMVVGIVRQVRDQKEAAAYRAIARELSVPIGATQYTTGADVVVTRQLFGRLQGPTPTSGAGPDYDPEQVISPAYSGVDPFTAQGVFDPETQGDEKMAVGWIVDPGAPTGGIGYVPGTGNLAHNFFFPAGLSKAPGSANRGCRAGPVRDLGSLYPSATGLANGWWSAIQQPGPGMFQVAPLRVQNAWQNYIYHCLVFAKDMLRGWTCAPTAVPFSDKFRCVDGTLGMGGCTKAKRGQTLSIPADFGRSQHTVYLGYLYELFFGLEDIGKRNEQLPLLPNPKFYENDLGEKFPEPDSIDLSQSVPHLALQNLYDRQDAVLRSLTALYVNGHDAERFPAFRSGPLTDQWEESVIALLQSNDWRGVTYQDMPEGGAKQALADKAAQLGLDPNQLNPPCPPGESCPPTKIAMGPSVLGDPVPPDIPPINDVKLIPARAVASGSRGRGGAGVLVAAVAAALLLGRKR